MESVAVTEPAARAETPDAVKPPPGNPRFPMIDGLRAVAALAVLVGHTSYLSTFNGHGAIGAVFSRLDVGVTLFFLISGFLLYRPFVAARLQGRAAPSVPRYFRRRILRIVPAYWLALTVLAIWPGLPGDVFHHLPTYYLFLQVFHVGTMATGIPAAWSLAVEVQFYVLLPVYALAVAALCRGRAPGRQAAVELTVLATLAVGSTVARTLTYADPTPDIWSHTIVGTFLWFSLGMGLAVLSVRWADDALRPGAIRWLDARPLWLWAAGLAIMVAISRFGLPTTSPQFYSTAQWCWEYVAYGAIALCVVTPATLLVVGRRSPAYRVTTWGPVAWLGLVSYGIFLWHHPLTGKFMSVQTWTTHGSFPIYTAVVLAVATTLAALSYYLLERPILRFKDGRPGRRPSAGADPETVAGHAPGRAAA